MTSKNKYLLKKILLFLLKLLVVSIDTDACGEHKRWYDFIIEREHLLIRNIYTEDELEKMEKINDICCYYDSFEKFIELVPIIEQALECLQWIKKKEKLEDFMRYDLNNVHSHLGEVKEANDEVEVIKIEKIRLYR